MRKFQICLTAALVSLPVYSVLAQQAGQDPSLPKGVQTPNPGFECAKDIGARHDHGLEKGTGPAGKRSCTDGLSSKAASVGEPIQPPIRGHDHGKFHKGQ